MKRVYYYSERDLELMKKVAKSIDFGVSLDIIAALNESSTAIYHLQREKDIYKREVKKMVGDIMREMSRTNQEVKKPMIHKGFFFEYSDTVIDVCSDDIAAFRISIEETLKENNTALILTNNSLTEAINVLQNDFSRGLEAIEKMSEKTQKEVHYVTKIKTQLVRDKNASCIDTTNAIYNRLWEQADSNSSATSGKTGS